MSNINIEKIKETLNRSKKLVLKRVLPFTLTLNTIFGGTAITASAANIKFDNVKIDYENGQAFALEDEYKSSYVTDSEATKIEKIMSSIDDAYQNIPFCIANGAMSISHTGSKENSMARLLAHLNSLENQIQDYIKNMDSTSKKIVEKYVESKGNEAKLIYSNVIGISVEELEEYGEKYSCVFANSVGESKMTNFAVYQIKNNQIVSNRTFSCDDTKLSTNKSLIKIPKLEVTYKNSSSSVPTFKTSYTGVIVDAKNVATCNTAIEEIDSLYDKIEEAIEEGNYTKKSNVSEKDILVSIYGDTNLINQTINNKYSGIATEISKYLEYKQQLMISKVYEKNSKKINYLTFGQFAINNKPVRANEEQGFVYYRNNGQLYTILDKGYIKTNDLTNSKTSSSQLTSLKIDAYFGLNLVVDGKLYIPKSITESKVEPFVYNGITYLPARDVSYLYNANIKWSGKTNSVYISAKEIDKDLYYEIDGVRYYLNQLPAIEDTNAKYSTQMTKKQVTAYKGINVYFDNKLVTTRDENGNIIEPLVIDGTTYLPARMVVSIFDAELKWDASTMSVIMNRNNILGQEPVKYGDYYKEDSKGNKIPVAEEDIEFGNTPSDRLYYIDDNGDKVYIDEIKTKSIR